MTNNDILRRIRYIFNYSDSQMIAIFAQADRQVTRKQILSWLKKDDEDGYEACNDKLLATFLNGFINEKRGKREGAQPVAEERLNNNMILTKLKIALNMKAEDIIAAVELAGFSLSKHELSAFSRKPDHKNYRICKDQMLRNILKGIQFQHRGVVKPMTEEQMDKKREQKKQAKLKAGSKVTFVNPKASKNSKTAKASTLSLKPKQTTAKPFEWPKD